MLRILIYCQAFCKSNTEQVPDLTAGAGEAVQANTTRERGASTTPPSPGYPAATQLRQGLVVSSL